LAVIVSRSVSGPLLPRQDLASGLGACSQMIRTDSMSEPFAVS
jgi:hypothetical protein